tara:strand:+ start:502 stop:687 length:186 start_codon:yes stop_codon:yes gene_type:complete
MKIGDLVRYTPDNKGDLEGVALVVRSDAMRVSWVVRWLDDGTEDYTCDFLPGELEVINESR